MKRPEAMGSGQSGQVLVLALVCLLLLAVSLMGVIQVMGSAAIRIKMQNAADQLALSAATLKARVLNHITDVNGVLEFVVLENGRIHTQPYYSTVDMGAGWSVAGSANASAATAIRDYNLNLQALLGRIARENGVHLNQARAAFYTLPILANRDFSWNHETIRYWQEIPYPPWKILAINPQFPAVKIEPLGTPWFVQVRLEWKTHNSLLAGKQIFGVLPEQAVRSRAEIFAVNPGAAAWKRRWRVRLSVPDKAIDSYLCQW